MATMTAGADHAMAHALREHAHAMVGAPQDFDPLLARVGDARFVLIGEASHGTHEFYRFRAGLPSRLTLVMGVPAVAF
jgi:erythromycin esterase-like protein